jgi:hypothetical protein
LPVLKLCLKIHDINTGQLSGLQKLAEVPSVRVVTVSGTRQKCS